MRSWSSNATKRPANVSRVRQPHDWLLLFHVACFASAAPMLMRLQLPRLQRLLEPKTRRPPPPPAQVQQITRYVEVVRQRGRPLVRSSCLTRGLTLYYFLRRSGLEVTLEFGMGKSETEFAGHCWLVKDGEPFLEKSDPRLRFETVYRLAASD